MDIAPKGIINCFEWPNPRTKLARNGRYMQDNWIIHDKILTRSCEIAILYCKIYTEDNPLNRQNLPCHDPHLIQEDLVVSTV